MGSGTANFRHFILGLLEQQPMSGYDVKSLFERLNWLIGSSSFGSIYPTLHTLLEKNLVSVHVVSNPDRPSKKVYSITDQGRQAVRAWIQKPTKPATGLRTFAMRLLMASHLSTAGLIEHLQQRRAQVADQRTALQELLGESDEPDLGKHLVSEYGLTMVQAELDWLDNALERLRQEPLIEEAVEKIHA